MNIFKKKPSWEDLIDETAYCTEKELIDKLMKGDCSDIEGNAAVTLLLESIFHKFISTKQKIEEIEAEFEKALNKMQEESSETNILHRRIRYLEARINYPDHVVLKSSDPFSEKEVERLEKEGFVEWNHWTPEDIRIMIRKDKEGKEEVKP